MKEKLTDRTRWTTPSRQPKLKPEPLEKKYPDDLVIAADTVVTIDGLVLGKPASRQEAREMLEKLSGRKHQVITALALFCHNGQKFLSDYEITEVIFKPLSSEDIEAYLALNSYADKAGAYALQDVKEKFLEENQR